MAIYVRKSKDRKGRKSYYYSFRHDKKQVTGTAKGLSHIRAEVARAEQLALQRMGKGVRMSRTPLLSDFIADVYLPWAKRNKVSHYNDGLICKEINKFFENERLSDVTSKRVRAFTAWRTNTPTQHGRPRANATTNREVSVLSKILSLAVEDELIDVNPCGRVKSLKNAAPRLLYWTEAEESKVMEHLMGEREHLRAIVMSFLYTGARQKELFQLTVDRLDFEANVIHVRSYKTNAERVIAMEPFLRPVLRAQCLGRKGTDVLFPSMKTGQALTTIKKGLGTACRLAGVKNIGVHGLRHTRGTRLAMRGLNAFQIAAEMGHTDVRTTARYVHVAEASARARLPQKKAA